MLKLAETASGLQYLHSIGIKHSDLKPVRTTTLFYFYFTISDDLRRQISSSTVISIPVSLTTDSPLGCKIQ